MENKTTNRLMLRICKMDVFPKFNLYNDSRFVSEIKETEPNKFYSFSHSLASLILYSPYMFLEDMIVSSAKRCFLGKVEYEDVDNKKESYYDQFMKWFNIPENKKSVIESCLGDLYCSITKKRKRLPSLSR